MEFNSIKNYTLSMNMNMKSFCHVRVFTTPWTVARQAPLSVGILQARILEWVAISFSRGSSNPGIKPRSPALQVGSLPTEPQGKSKRHFSTLVLVEAEGS